MKKSCQNKIYKNDEYTMCVKCKDRCEEPIKCFRCGTIDYVFYNRKHDIFCCSKCDYAYDEELRRAR